MQSSTVHKVIAEVSRKVTNNWRQLYDRKETNYYCSCSVQVVSYSRATYFSNSSYSPFTTMSQFRLECKLRRLTHIIIIKTCFVHLSEYLLYTYLLQFTCKYALLEYNPLTKHNVIAVHVGKLLYSPWAFFDTICFSTKV